jgi:DNA-binding NtrC family response regulator
MPSYQGIWSAGTFSSRVDNQRVTDAPSTLLEGSQEPGVGKGLLLRVMGPEVFVAHALPADGPVIVGRGHDVDIALHDPAASRRHARLSLGAQLTIEDLESANGTRLRDHPLAPGRPVKFLPGEAILIGATILMVLPNQPHRKLRHLVSYEAFESRATWECARAEAHGDGFCLLRLQADSGTDTAVVEATFDEILRPMDMATTFAPGHFDVLLPSLTEETGAAMGAALLRALRRKGGHGRLGQVTFPRSGRHLGALRAALSLSSQATDAALPPGNVASENPAMVALYALADRAATGDISVLILGETGVGKDVMARRIHARSPRADKAFVCVNCAALSESLLESELFGHERGAFTGAGAAKPGLLETAPGGTVLLDEIGDMAGPLQAKLLSAIENKEITRVGGLRPRPINVRFLAATNRDLEAAVAVGGFRRDLYFRLNGITLLVPPLRERSADIPRLANSFLAEFCKAKQCASMTIAPAAMALLVAYAWPGNLRELRNVMERAFLLADGPEITGAHLPATLGRPDLLVPAQADERARILAALAACAGNQTRAARSLGMSRKVLIARLTSYGVTRPRMSGS